MTPTAFTLDPSTGKPTLSSPSQFASNCGVDNAPPNALIAQQTLADGSYVDTINF